MKNNKGSALVETLIALGVAVLIIGAITGSVMSSLKNAEYAKKQNIASQYAQQGIELVRKKVRTNWALLIPKTYCLLEDSTELIEKEITCGLIANEFVREVKVVEDPLLGLICSGGKEVEVKVMWTDSKCANPLCHDVILSSCFTNHNEVTFN
ncbi:hypothetical protein KKG52_01435 [Patescibacteria group bacterium]|nr:hypothetical protein [Patescibacteria group bacterium]